MQHLESVLSRSTKRMVLACAVLTVAVSFLFATPAWGADKTWDGGGGGDTNVTTAANWDLDTLPQTGDRLIFDSGSGTATWNVAVTTTGHAVLLNTGFSGTLLIGASSATTTFSSSTVVAGTLNIADKTLAITGALTIAGGTVTSTFGSGTLNLNGDLNLNSGTFVPAGTTNLYGHWTLRGGTLSTLVSGSSYTLKFVSSTADQTFTTGGSSYTYLAVTLNNSAGSTNDDIVVVGTFQIAGALTITAGNLDLSTNNAAMTHTQGGAISLDGGAQATLTWGTGNVTFSGNFTINGSSSITSGSGTFISNHATTSTITLVSGTDLGPFQASGNVTFPGGTTFTVSSTIVDSGKYMAINGGGTTMTIDGNGSTLLTETGTIIEGSGSTIKFTGSAGGTLPATTLTGSITLDSSGQTFTAADGGSFSSAGDFTIASGSTLSVPTGVTITISGGLTNSGTITEAGTGKIIKTSILHRFTSTSAGTTTTTVTDYIGGSTLYFFMTDSDENIAGATADTLTAIITAPLGDRETVTLTETGAATGIFSGSITIRLTDRATTGDGVLDMNGTGTVILTYTDEQHSADTANTTISLNGAGVQKAKVYPTNPIITINNGAVATTSSVVTLSFGATDASDMVFSTDPNFVGAVWEPLISTKKYTLSTGFGKKKVYAKYTTSAGFQSVVVSSTIDYVAPGTPIPPTPAPVTPVAPVAPTPVVPTPATDKPIESVNLLSRADLLKTADSPVVYYFGRDGKRHAFPTAAVFSTWYADFSKVRVVSHNLLASISLGKNMSVRPGTKLIKITTDPKVYAIGFGGTLHWVTTETLAKQLYGDNWAKQVIDVPDTYFVDYKRSSDIVSPMYPDGTTVRTSDSWYFVEEGKWRMFTSKVVLDENVVPASFIIWTTVQKPGDGRAITGFEELVAYPTKHSAPVL